MIAQALPSEKVGPFYSVEALSCRDDRDGGTSPGAVHLACPEGEPVFLRQVGGEKCLRLSAPVCG
jgi:hypothetical protein